MLPVAPSAIKPAGEAFIENENDEGQLVPFVLPRVNSSIRAATTALTVMVARSRTERVC
jgi:N-ethylmaleimide reductase